MTTPADSDPITLESLAKGQQQLAKILTDFIAEQREVNAEQRKFNAEQREVNAEQREVNADHTRRLSAISNDLGVVKGGHARTEVLRKASLIATDMGYIYGKNLRRTQIEAIANKCIGLGGDDELKSFRNADLVMEVTDLNGKLHYIAVEVSYTVNKYDAERAIRNAGFLKDATKRESHAAVAGIDILPDAEELVRASNTHWYEIPPREIQPA